MGLRFLMCLLCFNKIVTGEGSLFKISYGEKNGEAETVSGRPLTR